MFASDGVCVEPYSGRVVEVCIKRVLTGVKIDPITTDGEGVDLGVGMKSVEIHVIAGSYSPFKGLAPIPMMVTGSIFAAAVTPVPSVYQNMGDRIPKGWSPSLTVMGTGM